MARRGYKDDAGNGGGSNDAVLPDAPEATDPVEPPGATLAEINAASIAMLNKRQAVAEENRGKNAARLR